MKDIVRYLFETNAWGSNEELLPYITIIVLCQKLGVTSTGGKRRVDMRSKIREFRDPEEEASVERTWKLPNKCQKYFGLPF